jgi:hypothetical protein
MQAMVFVAIVGVIVALVTDCSRTDALLHNDYQGANMHNARVSLLATFIVLSAAPAAAATAAATATAAAAPPVQTEAVYMARCRSETIARTPALVAQAESICRSNWEQVVAAGPMADALLSAAPRLGSAFNPAAVKVALPSVQWAARPMEGTVASGRMGEIVVTATRMPVLGLTQSWFKEGEPIPFQLEEALRGRGATLTMIACLSFGAAESTRVYRVAAAGKSPFALTIAQRGAAVASQSSDFNASADFSGRMPALADLRRDGSEWAAACL